MHKLGRENWVHDSAASACARCDRGFTTFRRRHHCRACGRIFCYDCCNQYTYVHRSHYAQGEEKSRRVCMDCFEAARRLKSQDSVETLTGVDDDIQSSSEQESPREMEDTRTVLPNMDGMQRSNTVQTIFAHSPVSQPQEDAQSNQAGYASANAPPVPVQTIVQRKSLEEVKSNANATPLPLETTVQSKPLKEAPEEVQGNWVAMNMEETEREVSKAATPVPQVSWEEFQTLCPDLVAAVDACARCAENRKAFDNESGEQIVALQRSIRRCPREVFEQLPLAAPVGTVPAVWSFLDQLSSRRQIYRGQVQAVRNVLETSDHWLRLQPPQQAE